MGLKIGLVTGEYPPMEGGVGAFTSQLAKALAMLGHEIHIIASGDARPDQSRRSIWEPHEPVDVGFAQLHPRINRWRWSAVNTIADIAVQYDLNVVNLQYQAAAFDMNIPAINFLPWRLKEVSLTVVTFHDLRVPYLFPKAGRLRPWVVYKLARSADGVIVTNAEDFARLQERDFDPRRLMLIPIGSNVRAIQPLVTHVRALRKELGLGNDDLLLGYFGFLNASKGADILLQVLKQLDSEVHLAFIGARTGSSDPENVAFLEHVESTIAQFGLASRIHWSGFLSDAELSTYFGAVDIMVMPYRDGVSLRRGTLMAILANGRPLITTEPSSPIPELIHGENVWLTPIDDTVTLKEAISQLAADPDLRIRLGRGAALLAKSFSWDRIAQQTSAFFEAITNLDL